MSEAKRGFVGGFFGCFGVLFAVVAVVVVILMLGMCSSAVAPRGQASPGVDYNRFVYAGHCLNGLDQAATDEAIGLDREASAVASPWNIFGRQVGNETRLTCNVIENGQAATVVVDVLCQDSDNPACTRYVTFERVPSVAAR